MKFIKIKPMSFIREAGRDVLAACGQLRTESLKLIQIFLK